MKDKKKIIFPVLFVILSVAIVIIGLSVSGGLPEIEFPTVTGVFNDNADNNGYKTNPEIIKSLASADSSEFFSEKLPDNMNAVWVDFNKDLSADVSKGTDSVKFSVYDDINYYRNFLTDTYFIAPDTDGAYKELKENDGKDFDILSYFLYFIKDLSCKAILVADEGVIFNGGKQPSYDLIKFYLDNYRFDAVVMSADSLSGTEEYFNTAVFLSSFIKTNYPNIPFGIEARSDKQSEYADPYVAGVFENNLADFALVDCGGSLNSKDLPFDYVAGWWNSFADYYGKPVYCKHRTDLVFTDRNLWGNVDEIKNQLKALYNHPDFDGSCFYSGASLRKKANVARDLSIFINDVANKEDVTFSVSELNLDSANQTVKFKGFTRPEWNVFCSDEPVSTSEGKFEQTYNLLPGDNHFYFTSSGQSAKYDIYNNSPLILSHYPVNGYKNSSDSTVNVTAVCSDDAYVFAVIGGHYFQMHKSTFQVNTEVPAGYSVFTYPVKLNILDKLTSAELDIVCVKQGSQVIAHCGKVIADNSAGNLTETVFLYPSENLSYSAGFSSVSPLFDNGLGNSLMFRIKYDKTEQLGEALSYDTYRPYHSDLLKDTLDYVTGFSLSEEGHIIYETKSGIKVYGSNCELISNAYTMPLNNIRVLSFEDSLSNQSKFVFGTDWLVPVTVTPGEPDYSVGFMDFSYNIKKYDVSYIDVNFHNTATFTDSSGINFSSDSVFSSYELFKNENDSLILRLHLKNPGKYYGHCLSRTADGNIELSFKKRSDSSVAGKTVMIDAGHGGYSMTGTALSDDSVCEAEVTLALAHKVKAHLEAMGASVIMTRTMDSSITLGERSDMCEKMNPDVFISIHCDGSDKLSESGTHTFYFKPYSQPLAENIHMSLVNAYRTSIYTPSDSNYDSVDKKIKYYPFYVTRIDNCPSVLIETGFMTNFVEGMILVNPGYQDILSKAIADGIAAYFYAS